MLPGMKFLGGKGKPIFPMAVTPIVTSAGLTAATAQATQSFSLTMPAAAYAQLLIVPFGVAANATGLSILSVTWNGINGVQNFGQKYTGSGGGPYNSLFVWVIEVPPLATATTANLVITKSAADGVYCAPIAVGPYLSPTMLHETDFDSTPYGDRVRTSKGGVLITFVAEWFAAGTTENHTWTGATEYVDVNAAGQVYSLSAAYALTDGTTMDVSVASTRTISNSTWGMFIGSWR